MSRAPLLALRGLRKIFGSVTALGGVDLEIAAGEIHAIVGENGAGKSTLLRILGGAERPDAGAILLDGRAIGGLDPREARHLGIRCVPQELELFDERSVCENIFAGAGLPARGGWIRWRAARRGAAEALGRIGRALPLAAPAGRLSTPDRALVQIATALVGGARVLALDEPTASLGAEDARRLFAILRERAARGTGILYVSHRLAEVLALADRVTVLRDGRRIWTRPVEGLEEGPIIEAMVGRRLDLYFPRPPRAAGEVALEVEGLTDRGGRFRGIDLRLRRGEVLGLYGVIGAGCSELARAIAGLRPARGRVACGGRTGPFRRPGEARAAGIAYLPADRLAEGNLPGRSVRENLTIACIDRFGPPLRVDHEAERRFATEIRRRFAILCPDLEAEIETLSGGNQQKALLGRTLSVEPDVLLLDEPTRGIDVGARAEIHRRIAGFAASGKAVLLVSSDLPEVLGMSHRVAVLREGRLVAEYGADAADEAAVARSALPASGEAGPTRGIPGPESERDADAPRPRWRRMARVGAPRVRPARPPGTFRTREAILALAIVLVAAGTEAAFPGTFSARSVGGLLATAAPLAAASVGMTLVIASGAIDLSVGSILALAGTCWALWARDGGSLAAGAGIAASCGALLGALNALLSIAARVHPIVVTLGTMGILRGLFLLWMGGRWLELPDAARDLAQAGPGGVPWTAWGAAAFVAAIAVFLRWRIEGRAILALGDNPRAARTRGIPLRRARIAAFTILGAAVGLAAVFHTARYGSLQSNTGVGFELEAIAAAVIGGARIAGGRGTAAGAALGALFLGLLADVRAVWGIRERWQLMIIGLLMLACLGIERGIERGAEEEA